MVAICYHLKDSVYKHIPHPLTLYPANVL